MRVSDIAHLSTYTDVVTDSPSDTQMATSGVPSSTDYKNVLKSYNFLKWQRGFLKLLFFFVQDSYFLKIWRTNGVLFWNPNIQ